MRAKRVRAIRKKIYGDFSMRVRETLGKTQWWRTLAGRVFKALTFDGQEDAGPMRRDFQRAKRTWNRYPLMPVLLLVCVIAACSAQRSPDLQRQLTLAGAGAGGNLAGEAAYQTVARFGNADDFRNTVTALAAVSTLVRQPEFDTLLLQETLDDLPLSIGQSLAYQLNTWIPVIGLFIEHEDFEWQIANAVVSGFAVAFDKPNPHAEESKTRFAAAMVFESQDLPPTDKRRLIIQPDR